jgi:hypothetical protein
LLRWSAAAGALRELEALELWRQLATLGHDPIPMYFSICSSVSDSMKSLIVGVSCSTRL